MVTIKSISDRTEEYNCECKGRNRAGNEVFDISTWMTIRVSSRGDYVEVSVDCPYNTGSCGQNCKAAHPHLNNVESETSCPYTFSLPVGKDFLLEHKKERTSVNRDLADIANRKESVLHPWKSLFE